MCGVFFFFKQKTAYEMRIRDWSSDVCSSDLAVPGFQSLGRLLVGDDIVDPGADLVALTKVGKLGEARQFLGRDRRRILRHPGRHHVAEEVGPAVMHQVDLFRDMVTSRSVEHTSELQSLMRISYAVLCLKK